ncbi:MAG: leucyl/phenylalanyl-tRNA--protein transferase [Armatimonadetes bacterium]|nr:leucyl/phenylalanyl-tRNA--protein transferase [Armatimonadota bacterium]
MRWQLPEIFPPVWFSSRGRPIASLADVSPEGADENGVVALGGELSVPTLSGAYRRGIFPWPHTGLPLCWFCPDPRAILDFADLHVPKSLEKERKKARFTFTTNTAFAKVIRSCRTAKRPEQGGTWITTAMVAAYVRLYEAGFAHSVEAWNESGELVGGLYGVDAGGVFVGESMFYREPYASKLCLLHLFDRLRENGGDWLDIQMMTPHFEQLGAKEIPRTDFLRRLSQAQALGRQLFAPSPVPFPTI